MNALARSWLRRIALGLPIVTTPVGAIAIVGGTACSCPPDQKETFPIDERQAALVISDDGRTSDLAGCQQVCAEVTSALPDGGTGDAGPYVYRPQASGCSLRSMGEMLYVECSFPVQCIGGRKPAGLQMTARAARDAGEWLARMAWMESAAVPAFEDLAADLARLGAPRSLVLRATRAADDERRHADAIARLARARGGATIPAVERAPTAPPSLLELARDNAAEGGVRETFGALLAAVQSERATDPDVRRTMRAIARDEARHALLSDAIDRWAGPRVDRDAIARARAAAAREMARAIENDALSADVSRALGIPDTVAQQAMLSIVA